MSAHTNNSPDCPSCSSELVPCVKHGWFLCIGENCMSIADWFMCDRCDELKSDDECGVVNEPLCKQCAGTLARQELANNLSLLRNRNT